MRFGPRPRDSSSCGAGRVSGGAGFGMTQSPKQGPGPSASLSICDSSTMGESLRSQECLWEQPRPTGCLSAFGDPSGGSVLSGMPKAKGVPHSRVTASPMPSCSENSEPTSVWHIGASQEMFVQCRTRKVRGRNWCYSDSRRPLQSVFPAILPCPSKGEERRVLSCPECPDVGTLRTWKCL